MFSEKHQDIFLNLYKLRQSLYEKIGHFPLVCEAFF